MYQLDIVHCEQVTNTIWHFAQNVQGGHKKTDQKHFLTLLFNFVDLFVLMSVCVLDAGSIQH
jgi:hypothetical protein